MISCRAKRNQASKSNQKPFVIPFFPFVSRESMISSLGMTEEEIESEKARFRASLKEFANSLTDCIMTDGEWTIKGFIDVFKQIYTISTDTKVISKILEIHLFPHLLKFAEENDFSLELAKHQNYYPDITLISKKNPKIMFAVDLKTSYRDENKPENCNGFTLGSHGEYFQNRDSCKNIQHPYHEYIGHYCLGIIYTREHTDAINELKTHSVRQIKSIKSVIRDFIFFAEEKWKIASDKSGSGNTANIGSIRNIADILSGNGVFARAGERIFDDYWTNYGVIKDDHGKITSFPRYLQYRNLPQELNNRKI